jgi:hypothetical protein
MTFARLPYYVINFSASNCFFEIRVNDVPLICLNLEGQASTILPVNHLVPESGKQVADFTILPTFGKLKLSENASFSATLQLYDVEGGFKLVEERNLYKTQEIKADLPSIKYKCDFDALVPYKITSLQNSTDLNDIDNLRSMVDQAYKKLEKLINAKQYTLFTENLKLREDNICKSMYLSDMEKSERMGGLVEDFKNGFVVVPSSPQDIMTIYGNGKLVGLRTPKGESALRLYNSETKEGMNLDVLFHLEKGSSELTII